MAKRKPLDMTTTIEALTEALTKAEELHGVHFDDPESWRNNTMNLTRREHTARVNRELMHLSDLCVEASVEVKREYWHGKGME